MNKVSLYIAKRYNTYTLLISIALISIVALLTGTLIYMSNTFVRLLKSSLYGDLTIGMGERLMIYSICFCYIIIQILIVYLFFNRVLKKLKPGKKLPVGLLIAVLCAVPAVIIQFTDLAKTNIGGFASLILLSTGLLSLIIGLLAFLFSRRKITGVNIITSIAVFAITIASCALFIILSVFSGLEKMNIRLFTNVNPDLRVSPIKGKELPDIDKITKILDNDSQVLTYSKVIEEKVSIEFDDKQDIAYIKGIDPNYKYVVKVDTAVVYGSYFDFKNPYEILASDGVARRLQMYIDHQHTARLRMPKPGTGLIKTEEEAFNTAVASPIGVFIINDQFDKYVFAPIELTQILLNLPPDSAYAIEVRLKAGATPAVAKTRLQKEFGNQIQVETRQDLDATFLKVMNVENLIIYLIFTLVIIIASFNLAGAIIIIIIDKKEQIKTIWGFGMPLKDIKQIFFQTGVLITLFSVAIGLIQGSIIGWMQNNFHLVMANPFVAFPFEFTILNYLTVTATVLLIGGTVSWLVSRKLPI